MNDLVFVCVVFEGERAVGHAVRPTSNFDDVSAETMKPTNDAPSHLQNSKNSEFAEILKKFDVAIGGYRDFVPLVLTFAPFVTPTGQNVLLPFLEAKCTPHSKTDTKRIYALTESQLEEFQRLESGLQIAHRASYDLPRMLLTGLIASLDFHLLALFRATIKKNPSSVFGPDRTIPVADVINVGSVDKLKEYIVETEIEKLSRLSFEDQISRLEKISGIKEPIKEKYRGWDDLLELIERRNLFVHNGGIVNESYKRTVSGLKSLPNEIHEVAIGDELHVAPKYYNKAVNVVSEFGVFLTQTIWRKLYPDERPIADRMINDYTYRAIESGSYKHAIRLLEEFVKFRKLSSDETRRIMVVNLANAKRLDGDLSGANAVLDAEDWSAVGRKFRISVASIKGDLTLVTQLMKEIGKDGDVTKSYYESWPVFYKTREAKEFLDSFEEVFGERYSSQPEKRNDYRAVLSLMTKELEAQAKAQELADLKNDPETLELSVTLKTEEKPESPS